MTFKDRLLHNLIIVGLPVMLISLLLDLTDFVYWPMDIVVAILRGVWWGTIIALLEQVVFFVLGKIQK